MTIWRIKKKNEFYNDNMTNSIIKSVFSHGNMANANVKNQAYMLKKSSMSDQNSKKLPI